MAAKRLSNELLIALMQELFTAVDRVGLSASDVLLLTDLTPAQFQRGLRLARRAGQDIAYDHADKRFRMATDYAVGQTWAVGRFRDIASRETTVAGFLAGLAIRHPDHAALIGLMRSSVAHTRDQAEFLADLLEKEDRPGMAVA
jgi:hypothetical protein